MKEREAQFWASFNRLVELVGAARRTELLLRIAIDAKSRADAIERTGFDEFSGKPLEDVLAPYLGLTKKQFGSQLSETFSDELLEEMNSIREVAGALAHAQVNQTRKKVSRHLRQYEVRATPNDNDFPGVLINNIRDEEGGSYAIAYHAAPSIDNSTMQEWEIFVHHGFPDVCNELFDRATSIVRRNFASVVMQEDMTRMMIAMKHGEKIERTDN